MFPDDPLLAELAADGFAGAPVRAGDGPVLGVLAVLDDRPLGDRLMARRLLGAVAARCAIELVRQRSLLSLRHSERHYRLLTGIGMTPEQMSRLFHPFSQADSSTTRKFGGTGLGLAISQRPAKMLDGEINCESRIGKGAVFGFASR